MAGFNSPNILFLNTYDAPDRKFIRELAPKLIDSGYERYAELYCGAFVMPLIVAKSGMDVKQIYAYDISLFSNILGYVFSGKDLQELEVKKNGADILLHGDYIEDGATLLYEQALARLKKAYDIDYFKTLVDDMEDGRNRHIDGIAERLKGMDDVLHGINFERMYIWDAWDKEKDKDNTFVVSNPPTYKGAYEKFFDTDGVITWVGDDIDYEIWDGSIHCKQLLEKAEDCKALLMFLQQADKGKQASENPISARYLSARQNVYWNTNKPEVVKEIQGIKEGGAVGAKRRKSKYKILPPDYEITEKSRLDVFVEDNQIAEYYRRIWAHRINGKAVSVHFCVLVDGMIAGFIGYDFGAIIKPYRETDKNTIIMSYAFPAPNKKCRLARLLVDVAKNRPLMTNAIQAKSRQYGFYMTIADDICTVEYTKYPEVKGLRGLMKIGKKDKKEDNVYALTYYADLENKKKKLVIKDFVDKERAYKRKCQK